MIKGKKRLKVILIIIAVILIPSVTISIYGFKTYNKVKKVDLPTSEEELGIDNSFKKNSNNSNSDKENKLTNILLMGVDKQENASDALIVMTIDETNKKVKMTSIMRDSKVDLGAGMLNKVNYAYHYGGTLLSIKTINTTYKLDITQFIKLDFDAVAKIVDMVGGVEVNVPSEEITVVNSIIKSYASSVNEKPSLLTKSGKQLLNGQQVVGYCRNRKVGDYDYQRTERQRIVLNSLIQKTKDISPIKYPQFISGVAPYIETNMGLSDMLDSITKVIQYDGNGIEQARIPIDGTSWEDRSQGPYLLGWDVPKNLEYLHRFIYENTDRLTVSQK